MECQSMSQSPLELEVLTRIKREAHANGCTEKEAIRAYIQKQNDTNRAAFSATPNSERIILLPQCLRASNCRALLTDHGYICQHCNPSCQVHQISSTALAQGYKGVYILPGGSMAKKIIDYSHPHAIVGIACEKEALLGGMLLEKLGIVGRAILLIRDGCVNTLVKLGDVLKICGLRPNQGPSI
jgi:hypothetical protein